MTLLVTTAADGRPGFVPAPSGLPRLLPPGGREDLATHLQRLGSLPPALLGRSATQIVRILDEADLVGRGGAAFPTARKVRAVADAGRGPLVVVNAMEGEPASAKDRVLLALAPHLVLDGAEVMARALGASQVVCCLAADADADRVPAAGTAGTAGAAGTDVCGPSLTRVAAESLAAACDERAGGPVSFTIRRPPHRYVSGESSAVARWLDGGPALPATRTIPLARRGVGGRPTLLDNAETFAHIALIARFGPDWYRSLGHAEDPGTMLVTVTGAVRLPGVAEIAVGSHMPALLQAVGGTDEPVGAVLLGGYSGSWLDAGAVGDNPLLLRRSITPTPVGAGIVSVIPVSACGLAETARLVRYLAGETAGQCGPCVHGLPALADAFERLARPGDAADASLATRQLRRWCGQLAGRGACSHPDGVVRLVRSALTTFADDVVRHGHGHHCGRVERAPVLPLPEGCR